MADESAVWRAAENLIDRYSEGAVEQAELRARELRDSHNPEAGAFWMAVKQAAETLLRRRDNPSLH